MLQNALLVFICILFAVLILSMISEKVKTPYPIFLVISGLGISLIPKVPHIELQPDLVFLIFLPPLLYAAAWNTSWKAFRESKRAIGLLAFGLVIFTSAGVAFLAHVMIPGFPLALGFLLGSIISPPDAIAATSVLQTLKVPKRVVTILEGESLVNDASSLIVFRFALAAIATGQFSFGKAAGTFAVVVVAGIAIGLVIALLFYAVHKYLPTSPAMDTAISLIAPYLMYMAAEHFHCSGVLAVVSGGLFLSSRSSELFHYNSRIGVLSFWNTFVFLLNGIVFILIGLQLPVIMKHMNGSSIGEAIGYGMVISIVTILLRLLWVFPGTYLPRFCSKNIRSGEPRPDPKAVFIVAWSGMRGVVSLASALSVPLTLASGEAFPHRNLILFITFIVILVTLVLQGLSLPVLIKRLNIEAPDNEMEQNMQIQLRLSNRIVNHVKAHHPEEMEGNDHLKQLVKRYAELASIQQANLTDRALPVSLKDTSLGRYRKILNELVHIRRDELKLIRREQIFDDELLRRREMEIDFEEARLKSLT